MSDAFERVTTERLLLRRVQERDLDAIFELHATPELSRFTPSGPLRSVDAARERLTLWQADWAQKGVGYWVVEQLDAPGTVVGFGGLRHKELEGQQVLNLAYRFLTRTWGSGYATEMARMALALGRKHIPEVPVVAIIFLENVPSLRVAERIGMRRDRVIEYFGVPSAVYL
ncbi:GNAT family N-acetyltransferase [Pyxidicoccus xibeiensis]|uniref:GNAT family N-acetyltransferase n=1 Tax=Pyxidicoccus xibeiensis TaxID=2906759 RepID=UPI0020A81E3E|nr:GNAT family N-acetyltransferase [Pyxidicoccus xibeiensis]MCP3143040.1 GNAT family N-acetyltransferase [Pyxidicoccus xibeiensis]